MEEQSRSPSMSSPLVAWIALGVSLISLVVSVNASVQARAVASDDTYAHLVAEINQFVRPIARDFGIKLPSEEPASLREALEPFFGTIDPLPSPPSDP